MLRTHFMQQWFSLGGQAMEEAFLDTPLYRDFAQLPALGRLPDESTILRFHHRLEKHKLADQVLATVNERLEQRGLLHGQENGDAGYQGADKRPNAKATQKWHVAMRPGKRNKLEKSNILI